MHSQNSLFAYCMHTVARLLTCQCKQNLPFCYSFSSRLKRYCILLAVGTNIRALNEFTVFAQGSVYQRDAYF